jgi:hypothetical protein
MQKSLMKYLLVVLVSTYGIITSCSREDITQVIQKENTAIFQQHSDHQSDLSSENSLTDSEENHSTTGSVKGREGNMLKSVHYKIYNTDNVIVVELAYNTANYQSLISSVIQVTVNGQVLDQDIINRNIGIYSFSLNDLKPGWKNGDLIQWSFTETGSEEPISFYDSYILSGSGEENTPSAL